MVPDLQLQMLCCSLLVAAVLTKAAAVDGPVALTEGVLELTAKLQLNGLMPANKGDPTKLEYRSVTVCSQGCGLCAAAISTYKLVMKSC